MAKDISGKLGLLVFRKRLYLLIFKSFLGPFLVTFFLFEIIFLTQHILKYLDDFAGKGLGIDVYAELVFYFSFYMVPRVLPLTLMVSALITYGNLGEHNELTAIKSSGISLVRLLIPVFSLAVVMAVGSFLFNNHVIPKTNIKAYSLLWDIRTKAPAFNLKDGVFYNGLDGYRIRAARIEKDGETLRDILIYDHTKGRGNTEVLIADSGYMFLDETEHYLTLELFHGKRHAENFDKNEYKTEKFSRAAFGRSQMTFDLSGLQMHDTPERLFRKNKMMLTIKQLDTFIDSLTTANIDDAIEFEQKLPRYFPYGMGPDSLHGIPSFEFESKLIPVQHKHALKQALNQARTVRSHSKRHGGHQLKNRQDTAHYGVELWHNYTDAFACITMFLIGAPLGAVLKKGGLGLPFIVTVLFFVVYYFVSVSTEKVARQDLMDWNFATWLSNIILVPIGLYFLFQARRDARLFEFDFTSRKKKRELTQKDEV